MKKFTVTVLALIYMLSTLGVSAERFYCCGKLARTSFALGDSGNSVNTNSKKGDCCRTTKQSFKVKDQHVIAKMLDVTAKTFVALLPSVIPFRSVAVNVLQPTVYCANAPPDRKQTPIYLLNCTYRI